MLNLFRISLVIIFLFSFIVPSFAQSEEEMKVWQEYMTPGKMHEGMAATTGDWTYESTMWMAPDTDPVTSKGTMTSEMLLGGRYMKQVHKGEMMGMPFEGINIVGFDNAKQKYVSTWMDNMGTGMMTAEGTYDEATKSINMTGSYFDPMTKTNLEFREVVKMVSDKEQHMEMYMLNEGKEFKNMEIVFTKK
jgi:hypothetical protein